MNNKDTIINSLRHLGLARDESLVYLDLLENPGTHLQISRNTGVNRSKVYRIVADLEKRSLITSITDDSGTKLTALEPESLEAQLINEEQRLRSKQAALNITLPLLKSIKSSSKADDSHFSIATYDGASGFKQMLLHELKAVEEILIFDSGDIDDLVESTRWAEKHRKMTVEAGYKVRTIINPFGTPYDFTKNKDFMDIYERRLISPDILLLDHMVVIYNDTVATYCFTDGQKVGFEVINRSNAQMMRQMFENYWSLASQSV